EELRGQLQAGRQAYVVCPLVEDPEATAGEPAAADGGQPVESVRRAATAELRRLREGELQGYELALLHGGMRSSEKQEAMAAFAAHSDGVRLSGIDLGLRTEGELVGTRQSGFVHYRVASLPEDAELLERARARAEAIIAADPKLRDPEHALLGDALEQRFGAR